MRIVPEKRCGLVSLLVASMGNGVLIFPHETWRLLRHDRQEGIEFVLLRNGVEVADLLITKDEIRYTPGQWRWEGHLNKISNRIAEATAADIAVYSGYALYLNLMRLMALCHLACTAPHFPVEAVLQQDRKMYFGSVLYNGRFAVSVYSSPKRNAWCADLTVVKELAKAVGEGMGMCLLAGSRMAEEGLGWFEQVVKKGLAIPLMPLWKIVPMR